MQGILPRPPSSESYALLIVPELLKVLLIMQGIYPIPSQSERQVRLQIRSALTAKPRASDPLNQSPKPLNDAT